MNAYAFQDVTCNMTSPVGTVDLGYGSGSADEGITLNPNGDKNTMTVGADGTAMHSLHSDQSAVVTVRLLQTSSRNQILMAMYNASQVSSLAWGQIGFIVRQHIGGDAHTAIRCAFKKKPDIKYGKDGAIFEWPFDCARLTSVLGSFT